MKFSNCCNIVLLNFMGPKLSFVHSPKFKPVNAQGKDFNTKLKIFFFLCFSFNSYQKNIFFNSTILSSGSKLLKELKKLDDKALLVEVQLLESKVYHNLSNIPKSRLEWQPLKIILLPAWIFLVIFTHPFLTSTTSQASFLLLPLAYSCAYN